MKIKYSAHHLLLIITVLLCHGCKAPAQAPISGHIELRQEWKPMVYLIRPRFFSEIVSNYLGQVIDSAVIAADGQFVFDHLPAITGDALLEIVIQKTGNRFANHLDDEIPGEANYMPLVYSEGIPIVIHADASYFQRSFTIQDPSLKNQTLGSIRTIRLKAYDILVAVTGEKTEADTMLLEKEKAYSQYRNALMDFADTTAWIEAAMVAIRWISPTGDFERVPEFVFGQCRQWRIKEPNHPYTQQLCVAADKNKLPVMIGDAMPDFPLPLVVGDTMMLLKMLGNRLTIVDIWASWCAPCRKENKTILAPLWKDYHTKGFQIIGYSIDNQEQSWKAAIVKDGAEWTQASHLSGDATPFLEALHITTIPANFILDGNGKIIAKNLFGEDLEQFVHSLLK